MSWEVLDECNGRQASKVWQVCIWCKCGLGQAVKMQSLLCETRMSVTAHGLKIAWMDNPIAIKAHPMLPGTAKAVLLRIIPATSRDAESKCQLARLHTSIRLYSSAVRCAKNASFDVDFNIHHKLHHLHCSTLQIDNLPHRGWYAVRCRHDGTCKHL